MPSYSVNSSIVDIAAQRLDFFFENMEFSQMRRLMVIEPVVDGDDGAGSDIVCLQKQMSCVI